MRRSCDPAPASQDRGAPQGRRTLSCATLPLAAPMVVRRRRRWIAVPTMPVPSRGGRARGQDPEGRVCAAGGDAVTTYVALIRGFSVYDGDTLTNVTLDLGGSVWLATPEIRINCVDAPELADARQRPAAAAVRDWLARRIHPPRGAGPGGVSGARGHRQHWRGVGDVAA